jgi:quinol-cytochrome oxidoreductase complex cytochrome b subunit
MLLLLQKGPVLLCLYPEVFQHQVRKNRGDHHPMSYTNRIIIRAIIASEVVSFITNKVLGYLVISWEHY